MSKGRACPLGVGWMVLAILSAGAAARADSVGPAIDVWYGTQQTFGTPGEAQRWVNVLGNVSDPDGVSSLTYRLNGGAQRTLRRGSDARRLWKPGDFNVEIDYAELQVGDNTILLTARDNPGNTTNTTVTLTYAPGTGWPLPYALDLSGGADLQDVAQVVDGEWVISGGGVSCPVMGYDRVLAVGDATWSDYELVATLTVYALDPDGYQWPSVGPGWGITLRWPGHTNNPVACGSPHCGWLPSGGTVWYEPGANPPKLTLDGDLGLFQQQTRTLGLGVPYVFRMRVEEAGASGTFYAAKVWPAGSAEPGPWSLAGYEPPGDVAAGSAIFIAHHADLRIENVSVVPLGGLDPPVISNVAIVAGADSATFTWQTDRATDSRVDYGPSAAYGSTAYHAALVTSHSVVVGGLAAGTTYHARITSADGDGYSQSTQDLLFATIVDCNGNGVDDADEVEDGSAPDCNTNGVPDECDAGATSPDVNADGVPDECQVRNLTRNTAHATIAGAIAAAEGGDELLAAAARFLAEMNLNLVGKSVRLGSTGDVARPPGSALTLASGSEVASAPGGALHIAGTLTVPAHAAATLTAEDFELTADGVLAIGESANAAVNSGNSAIVDGTVEVQSLSTAAFSGEALIGGLVLLNGGTLAADDVAVAGAAARIEGYGAIVGELHNHAAVALIADAQLQGDLMNAGTITIQSGTLTVSGNVSGDGALLAAPGGREAAPAELVVAGSLSAEPGARLLFPHEGEALTIGGDWDVGISASADFDLRRAVLRFAGTGVRTVEVMGRDWGPDLAVLLDGVPQAYPLGTLEIEAGVTVELADGRVNTTGGGSEVVYVDRLVVAAGASLVTAGRRVYYRSLEQAGAVDDGSNLIRLVGGPCDCDLDGDVDGADAAEFVACQEGPFATPPSVSPAGCSCSQTFDADGDGDVDLADFVDFQGHGST